MFMFLTSCAVGNIPGVHKKLANGLIKVPGVKRIAEKKGNPFVFQSIVEQDINTRHVKLTYFPRQQLNANSSCFFNELGENFFLLLRGL